MKTNFTFKAGPLRCVLLLVVMMSLWQVGWAADSFKKMVRDGVTYYYGVSDHFADKYGQRFTVTDGLHSNENVVKTYTDDAGFEYKITIRDGARSVELTKIPDTEEVRVPEKMHYAGQDVAINALTFNSCGNNVKDIYFGSLLPESFSGKNATVHVSDAQFDAALAFGVKCVRADSRRALNSSLFTFENSS